MKSLRSTAFYWIVFICFILIAVNYLTIRTTSAVRAYINGESQYSKGQKDATNHLILYISTGETQYWNLFNQAIQIPLGDGVARNALINQTGDQIALKGFIQGKNTPEDANEMIWLVKYFGQIKFMQEAIELWSEGDVLTNKLNQLAIRQYQSIQSQSITQSDKLTQIKEINRISTQITVLADKFSHKLGTAARTVSAWLFYFNTIVILIIVAVTARYIGRAFRKLKSADSFKKKLMDASFEASIWYNKDSEITFWNYQAENTFGWKASEIIGKKLTETIIPKEYESKHKTGIENYINVGTPPLPNPRVETVAMHKDGTIIPIELSILPLTEGNDVIFCAHIFDLTNVLAQKELEDKQTSYLRAILESTDDGILATRSDGQILEANQRFLEQWGIDIDFIKTAPFEEVSLFVLDQIEDAENILAEVKELFTSDKVHTRLVYHRDGRIFERHSVPMILDKETIGRVWSFRDITDRIKAETDYKNLFENSAEGIYIGLGGGNGTLLTVNPAMAKMYGYDSPEQMLEQVKEPAIQFFVDQEDRQAIRELLKDGKTKVEAEYRSYKKSGEIFWVRNHLKFTVDKDGLPLRFEGSVEDISARKQAQEQLVQQIEELKKVNFELDRFVYSVSHDLRAPLLSIKGLVNISEKENPNAQLAKYLEMIRMSVDKLDRFILDILDYSRNSRLEVQKNDIDFKTLVNETINNMIHMEGYQHVLFDLNIELESKFVSDKRRIEIILNNLISNAIKYQDLEKPSQQVSISISELKKSNQLSLIVEDNGVGIEKASQDKIFDMFYRASDRSKGAGLGLYIIKETVEKMNGSIKLESKFGEYTKFIVLLPLDEKESTN